MTHRKIIVAEYYEWKPEADDKQRARKLFVNNPPIIRINYVGLDAGEAIYIETSGLTSPIMAVNDACMTLTSSAGTSVLAFADYATTDLLAAAISEVSGWTATASATLSVYWLCPGIFEVNTTATLYYAGRLYRDAKFDSGAGVITLPTHTGQALVAYRGGWETVPGDLQQLCREFAAASYNRGKVNANLQSESLGDHSYTLARTSVTDDQINSIRAYVL